MRVFLAVSGVLAWIIGVFLLFAAGMFYAPMGIVMSPLLAAVAQAHGATLLGVGINNWIPTGPRATTRLSEA